jgi:hypothetical protein
MSVLSIPVVVALVACLLDGLAWAPRAVVAAGAACLFLAGFANYAGAMVSPAPLPWGARQNARAIDDLHRTIEDAVQENQAIYWMLIDQGTHFGTFYVHWAERFSELPPLVLMPPPIESISEADLLDALERADVVVAPLDLNPNSGFRFPFTISVEELRPAWEPYMESHFRLLAGYALPQGRIGVYVRDAELLQVEGAAGPR